MFKQEFVARSRATTQRTNACRYESNSCARAWPHGQVQALQAENLRLCVQVLAPPRGTVPYPLLKENTLVLSDQMTLLRRRGGRLELSARVGDVYPNQAHRHSCVPHLCPSLRLSLRSMVVFAVLQSLLVTPSHEHVLCAAASLTKLPTNPSTVCSESAV